MAIFESIFTKNTSSISPVTLLIAVGVSLLLGFAVTWVYKQKTLYTREFVITLTLLPSFMTLVIFFVNGNLGTSVAVAGTFSLIRFRSATGGSRELLAIFLSMIIGLAAGIGFLYLAIFFTALLLTTWYFLENFQVATDKQRRRLLSIQVERHEGVEENIENILRTFTSDFDLTLISSSKSGSILELYYEIDLQPKVSDFTLSNYLINNISGIDISLTKQAKKRKNL